jgi:Tfp pilus assembly protein PilN
MRAVNLLPKDEARRGKRNYVVFGGASGFVIVTTALALMMIMAGATVAQKQSELDDAKQQLMLTPPPEEAPAAAASLPGEQQARLTALSTALQRRVPWDRVFREFSLVVPDDVWLDSLQAKAPLSPVSPASAPAPSTPDPQGFKVKGYTYSHDAVARLLSRLALVPELTNIRLKESTVAPLTNGRKIVKFEIGADIRTVTGPTS